MKDLIIATIETLKKLEQYLHSLSGAYEHTRMHAFEEANIDENIVVKDSFGAEGEEWFISEYLVSAYEAMAKYNEAHFWEAEFIAEELKKLDAYVLVEEGMTLDDFFASYARIKRPYEESGRLLQGVRQAREKVEKFYARILLCDS